MEYVFARLIYVFSLVVFSQSEIFDWEFFVLYLEGEKQNSLVIDQQFSDLESFGGIAARKRMRVVRRVKMGDKMAMG